MKKVIDEVFMLRLNLLGTTRILSLLDPMPDTVKEINDYANARGIKCAYTGVPSVEDIADYRKKIPRGQDSHSYDYRKNEGMFGWKNHAISWSRDDMAEAQAKRAALMMFPSLRYSSVSAAVKVSPAAVVSTAFTLYEGTISPPT